MLTDNYGLSASLPRDLMPWCLSYYIILYHISVLQDQAIWSEEDFNVWQPCRDTFDTQLDGYFNLVQSRIELDPAMIWDKISACFQVAGK